MKSYPYCGLAEIFEESQLKPVGTSVEDFKELDTFIQRHESDFLHDGGIFTFVISREGVLKLAVRRSEHVACAGRQDVLSAGEIGFLREKGSWVVDTISNHSRGYCPEPESWPVVESVLSGLDIGFPDYWTTVFHFRQCEQCGQVSILKEYDPFCPFCEIELPSKWNITPTLG